MSRSALWRQEAGKQQRERQAQDTFQIVLEEGKNNRAKGLIPLYGSPDTFNFHSMLLHNIAKSPYFIKLCDQVKDWNSLVDEIYFEVKHLEPWSPGAAKTPSTAFCLLLRLLTLRSTDKQMTQMLEHRDSPYIRCIGFLFLRYACEPQDLWKWCEPYIFDEETLQVTAAPARPPKNLNNKNASSPPGEMTVGEYVRFILQNLDYHGTRFPRLPVAMERDIKVKLLQAERVEERALRHLRVDDTYSNASSAMEYFQRVGNRVRAMYEDEENPVAWYDAVIDRVLTSDPVTREPLRRPKFVVTFLEYGNTETVTLGEMDFPDEKSADRTDGYRQHPRGRGSRREDYEYRGGVHRGREPRTQSVDRDQDSSGHGAESYHYGANRRSRSRSRERDEQDLMMEEVRRRERLQTTTSRGKSYAVRPASTKITLASKARTTSVFDERKPSNRRGSAVNDDQRPRSSSASRHHDPEGAGALAAQPPCVRMKTAEEIALLEEKKRKLAARYG